MTNSIKIDSQWQLPAGFHFSQSNLQDFVECERRFYLRHIERQGWPSPLAEPQDAVEIALKRGARFHQLVERHQMGIPLDILYTSAEDDPALPQWLDHYQAALKDFGPFERSWTETKLSTTVADHPVVAKFDFIGLKDNTLIGIDWKTGNLPPITILQERLQTLIYLMVLYREGHRLAGQAISNFSLVYVGVNDGQTFRFTVDSDTERRLALQVEDVINRVKNSTLFPLVEDVQVCRFCLYRGLCERGTSPLIDSTAGLDFENLWIDLDDTASEAYEF